MHTIQNAIGVDIGEFAAKEHVAGARPKMPWDIAAMG
jgi:hypothetical protein